LDRECADRVTISLPRRTNDFYFVGCPFIDMRRPLYSVDPRGSGPRCSHAHRRRSSGAAGPFAQRRGSHGFYVGSPAPRIHRQTPSMGSPSWLSCCPSLSIVVAYDAGRKTMPSDTSPLVARRQSAMSSLRASATIIVLRVLARLSAVRAANHLGQALSLLYLRKNPAKMIMPHPTPQLP